jgi:hypothetical protein
MTILFLIFLRLRVSACNPIFRVLCATSALSFGFLNALLLERQSAPGVNFAPFAEKLVGKCRTFRSALSAFLL